MNQKTYLEIRKNLSFKKEHYFLIEHLFMDLLLVGAFAFTVRSPSIALYLISQPLLALFFFRSFGLMHDAVHNSVSPHKKINTLVGYIYGSFCFLPFEAWKDIHMKHHTWASNIDRDPTYSLVKNYNPNNFLGNGLKNIIWKSWLPILGALQYFVFWKHNYTLITHLRQKKISITPTIMSIVTSFVIYNLFYISIGNISLAKSVIPAIFIYLVMVEVINFPHHLGLPVYNGNDRLRYKDQYKVSRSCMYPRWFSRFVLKNFNYHSEHHLYPDLPWYHLDKAHSLLKTESQLNTNFIKGNQWIIENRKVNLNELLTPEVSKKNDGKTISTSAA